MSAQPIDWTLDLVLQRLASAGLSSRLAGPVLQQHMSTPGTRIIVPGATLEVYFYGDANATAPDVDRFDRLTRAPGGTGLVWQKPAALITDNNLVIAIMSADPAALERVRKAFTLSPMHQSSPESR